MHLRCSIEKREIRFNINQSGIVVHDLKSNILESINTKLGMELMQLNQSQWETEFSYLCIWQRCGFS